MAAPSALFRHLCEDDRIHLADRLREKATVRAITAKPGRGPSTADRETRRNRHPVGGRYRPVREPRPLAVRASGRPARHFPEAA
ncbi:MULTISPECIES: hypothetical protein [Streptomyces]|uniref:hypothetical protein n=1 Tax=Streptomyces TaxID=1883 RepID=UPI00117D4B9F|nr:MULTISPECIES: hypothetical protein [Streptomyces]MDN5385624.1 hypothetical protein [Streptomyces sp. LB8]